MSTIEELERVIEQLPREDFAKLAAWIDQRRDQRETGQPAQNETMDSSKAYADPSGSSGGQMVLRDHSAFLSGYVPADEGLYDDAATR